MKVIIRTKRTLAIDIQYYIELDKGNKIIENNERKLILIYLQLIDIIQMKV